MAETEDRREEGVELERDLRKEDMVAGGWGMAVDRCLEVCVARFLVCESVITVIRKPVTALS